MANLKAYIISDRRYYDGAAVVFAETAGKAKALARFTDTCEGIEFTDVSARRAPALDKAYRGHWEMDWFNDQDRIAMVRDANFSCDLSDVGSAEVEAEWTHLFDPRCSRCNNYALPGWDEVPFQSRYCPHCGAKMKNPDRYE